MHGKWILEAPRYEILQLAQDNLLQRFRSDHLSCDQACEISTLRTGNFGEKLSHRFLSSLVWLTTTWNVSFGIGTGMCCWFPSAFWPADWWEVYLDDMYSAINRIEPMMMLLITTKSKCIHTDTPAWDVWSRALFVSCARVTEAKTACSSISTRMNIVQTSSSAFIDPRTKET